MGKEILSRLRTEMLALPEAERADLALALVKSLDGPADANVAAAWDKELLRRLVQIENGTAVLQDRDELSRRIKERLGKL